MKENESYLVVGGGITGCITALMLAEQGTPVTLCEASGELGGILNDHDVNGKKYFSGCQYFSVDEPWFNALPEQVLDMVTEHEHTYGSVSEFDTNRIATRSMAMPVFAKEQFKPHEFSEKLDNRTLCSRLSFYPDFIEKNLCKWVERYGVNPREVSGENATALQISRIHIDAQNEAVTRLKKQPSYDSVLAVPFNLRHPTHSLRAALPIDGFDAFFSQLEASMISRGVKILKNSPVKIKQSGNSIEFWTRSTKLQRHSHLVWAANPNPLLKGLGYPTLSNIHGNAEIHFYDIDIPASAVEPCYYQVFSNTTDINRLFIYTIAGKSRMTIECFAGNKTEEEIANEARGLLSEFDYEFNMQWQGSKKEKRYTFHSMRDQNVLGNMLDATSQGDCRVIDAGWLAYGRDAKIRRITDQIM